MDFPSEVEAVYVICNPQEERARCEELLPRLLSTGIPEEKLRLSGPTWGSTLSVEECFTVYDPFLKRGTLPTFSFKAAALTKGEISLALNFYAAVKDGATKSGPVLVFESDTWLRADFVPRLRDLLLDLSDKSWDYVSLGDGVGSRPSGCSPSYYGPTKAWEPPHQWIFRCRDSMMFQPAFLQKLSTTFIPFKEIIDWELNFQTMLHAAKCFWADPPLAEQGTWNSRTDCSLY
jgi:hypothetical protein